jgi:hypothetical protein
LAAGRQFLKTAHPGDHVANDRKNVRIFLARAGLGHLEHLVRDEGDPDHIDLQVDRVLQEERA